MIPKFNQRQFANIVYGDGTWFHYFEPVRKIGNKTLLIKHVSRLVGAKRTISIKKIFYCIFFSSDNIAVKIPMSRGRRRVTGMYYPDVTLKKLKEVSSTSWLCSITNIWAFETIFEVGESYRLGTQTMLSRSSPLRLFPILPKLKMFLSGRRYKSRQFIDSANGRCVRGLFEWAYRVYYHCLEFWQIKQHISNFCMKYPLIPLNYSEIFACLPDCCC